MKKILFAVLFLSTINAFAQNDAPTKEDAVAFIQKIYQENFRKEDEYNREHKISLVLKDCTPSIIRFIHFKNNNTNSSDTLFISLPEVALKEDEYHEHYLVALNEHGLINNNAYLQQYEHGRSPVRNKVFISDLDEYSQTEMKIKSIKRIQTIFNYDAFEANGYPARLAKAYEFLIKACGGGKLKVDPYSKF